MVQREYAVGRSTVSIVFGDIRQSSAEVLVSSDDYMLTMGGGVSRALAMAGGPEIHHHASRLVPLEAGDVAVTTAGTLAAKYIFHAVSIGRGHYDPRAGSTDQDHAAVIRTATHRALDLLNTLGCRSIAFPSIGTGVARIPTEVAAAQMASSIVEALLDSVVPLRVELYLMGVGTAKSPEHFLTAFEEFATMNFSLSSRRSGSGISLETPTGPDAMDPAAEASVRRAEVYGILRQLDARRRDLESRLVEALHRGAPLDAFHEQLREVEELRNLYVTDPRLSAAPDMATSPAARDSVFVSSTFEDLRSYRGAVREAIDRLGLRFVGMEDFGAEAVPPAEVICRKVRDTSRYLGIIGPKYGYVDDASGLSMTELEYSQAVKSDKPIHMFVMDDSVPVPLAAIERDPEKVRKLNDFRDRVMTRHTCAKFTDPADLTRKVEVSLAD